MHVAERAGDREPIPHHVWAQVQSQRDGCHASQPPVGAGHGIELEPHVVAEDRRRQPVGRHVRPDRPQRGQRRAPGTVEAFGRAEGNPVGGWYGQRKGYRGRFGMYLPPLLEALGLVELEHNARNNRVRAI